MSEPIYTPDTVSHHLSASRTRATLQRRAVTRPGAATGHVRMADRVRELGARLLASASAANTLVDCCDEHGIGNRPILARKMFTAQSERPDDELLDGMQPEPREVIRHRRVTLTRSDVLLSDCDLWWLPGRLNPDMVAGLTARRSLSARSSRHCAQHGVQSSKR